MGNPYGQKFRGYEIFSFELLEYCSENIPTACRTDADLDSYGDVSPASAVTAGTDCDDGDSSVSPSGTEVCNGADDDCNGLVDEDDNSEKDEDAFGEVPPSWFRPEEDRIRNGLYDP